MTPHRTIISIFVLLAASSRLDSRTCPRLELLVSDPVRTGYSGTTLKRGVPWSFRVRGRIDRAPLGLPSARTGISTWAASTTRSSATTGRRGAFIGHLCLGRRHPFSGRPHASARTATST